MSKQDALAQIVALAKQHDLTQAEIIGAVRSGVQPKSGGGIVMRLFSYLGAIFIFAGISAFVGMFWKDMNSAARVIITLGSGFTGFLVAVTMARDSARRNIVASLMIFAALLQTCGLFVMIDEYFNTGSHNWRLACVIVFGLMLVQQGFTYRALRLPILFFNALCFGGLLFAVIFDMMGIEEEWNATILGFSLLLIGYGLRETVHHYTINLCHFFGALLFLGGSFAVLERSPAEILYIGITCGMIYLSVILRSTTLLVTSVFAMLCFIGYFTGRYFVDSTGWPIALILFGMIFFGISAGAVRIKKKYFVN